MPSFHYRAVVPATGKVISGTQDGATGEAVADALRGRGLLPIETRLAKDRRQALTPRHAGAAVRKTLPHAVGELAVLLGAGLPLDRALHIVVEHIAQPVLKAAFMVLTEHVKAGMPLSAAMAEAPAIFPPIASALAAAGEASGRLDTTMTRLAEALDRAETLRQTVSSAMVYPSILLVVATGVIGVMLLVVVPQFENLMEDMGGKLPSATAMLMLVSRVVREWGMVGIVGLVALAFAGMHMMRRPALRAVWHRRLLRLPLFGALVASAETARLARTLGTLVEAGVALPTALAISGRALGNSHMARALASVAEGVKEGGGLSGPLAATGAFPPIALSFLRTGEETAQLGLMLGRLADVLDRDVRTATQRMITVMTPLITVILGLTVAGIIAALFSAILGINDLAIQS